MGIIKTLLDTKIMTDVMTNKDLEAWRLGLAKYLKESDDISQADIARKVGVSTNHISMIVTGKKGPSRKLQQIITDLIGEENIYTQKPGSEELITLRETKLKKALDHQKDTIAELELQLSHSISRSAELQSQLYELTRKHQDLLVQFERLKSTINSKSKESPHPATDAHAELVQYFQQKDLAKTLNWNLIKLEKADPKSLHEINEIIKLKLKINGVDIADNTLNLLEAPPAKKEA